MSLADLLAELDNIIVKLRYVKYGDYVLSSDHNDLVDAVKKIREILGVLQTAVGGLPDEPKPSDVVSVASGYADVATQEAMRIRTDDYGKQFAEVEIRGLLLYRSVLHLLLVFTDVNGNDRYIDVVASLPSFDVKATTYDARARSWCFSTDFVAITLDNKTYVLDPDTGSVTSEFTDKWLWCELARYGFIPLYHEYSNHEVFRIHSWLLIPALVLPLPAGYDSRYAWYYYGTDLVKELFADSIEPDELFYVNGVLYWMYYTIWLAQDFYKYIVAVRPDFTDENTIRIYYQIFEIKR